MKALQEFILLPTERRYLPYTPLNVVDTPPRARAKSWRLPSSLAQHWCNRPGTRPLDPYTQLSTFPVPYSYTHPIYFHEREASIDVITSKGSLPLPVRLST